MNNLHLSNNKKEEMMWIFDFNGKWTEFIECIESMEFNEMTYIAWYA